MRVECKGIAHPFSLYFFFLSALLLECLNGATLKESFVSYSERGCYSSNEGTLHARSFKRSFKISLRPLHSSLVHQTLHSHLLKRCSLRLSLFQLKQALMLRETHLQWEIATVCHPMGSYLRIQLQSPKGSLRRLRSYDQDQSCLIDCIAHAVHSKRSC